MRLLKIFQVDSENRLLVPLGRFGVLVRYSERRKSKDMEEAVEKRGLGDCHWKSKQENNFRMRFANTTALDKQSVVFV